ncbi:aminotransferase class III-fold pyridoxal phosphate-dependent enzyme (plasmid) [Tistrella bauzanensis]|uniref:aminotransferase class III-fold pyridoxal phosphate-dependent enzyme n=2 Tax=Tistrella TaxID=171436 RepID=UPI0031FB0267
MTGPEPAMLVARDAAAFLHQRGSTPVARAVVAAEGPWLTDGDGHRVLDGHGNGCHHIGYRHPRLVDALTRQLATLPFAPRRFTNAPAVALAERLAGLWPYGPARVLFAPSGSDAIEIALKLAYVATGRQGSIAFAGAWHGAGLGALSVGGRFAEAAPMPRLSGCRHVPAYWPADGLSDADAAARVSYQALVAAFASAPPPAALLAEPVHSAPGLPPPWFWPAVARLARDHGSLLIFDEIPTGLGKTGRWFASQHFDVTPDITVLGKALGGAVMPLAAVIAREDLDRAGHLAIGHVTHEKNPMLATAGLATLDVLADGDLVARAAELGARLAAGLDRLAAAGGALRGARVAGLLAALWLRADQDPLAVERRCYALGLNLTADRAGRLSLSLPLIVTASDIDRVVAVLAQALPAVEPVALPVMEPVALPVMEPVALPVMEPVARPGD